MAAPDPFFRDESVTFHVGDAREVLASLPDGSVDCVATSPPFYALRDYKVEGQIGLEATPEAWADALVAVFREARRVLSDTGTLWVECGDSYSAGGLGPGAEGAKQGTNVGSLISTRKKAPDGYKPKDLLGTPWLLAFALRADGWYLRQCLIWNKPNCMPESAKDRCTTAHSYIFLLSKKPRYWFDAVAIEEAAEWARWGDQTVPKYEGTETASGWMQPKGKNELLADMSGKGAHRTRAGFNGRWNETVAENGYPMTKHPRSVWTIPTSGFPGAHFATWPEALAEKIILSGCPRWICGTCGKPRERLTEVSYGKSPAHGAGSIQGSRGVTERTAEHLTQGRAEKAGVGDQPRVAKITETTGWSDCGHNAFVPGTILDPFLGSGTTAVAARRLGRNAVGVELNEEYAAMAVDRYSRWWKKPAATPKTDEAQTALDILGV